VDLIYRADAINAANDAANYWDGGPNKCREETIRDGISTIPPVPAVPLDKLCEWLERNAAGRWNGLEYTAAGWKDELTRWMEEQDAKEET
jgi:hypothetical protein